MSEFIWAEKYRPKTLEKCVFPKALYETFNSIINSKDKSFPNMIFHGESGVGKTTIARILCELTNHEYIIINGSKDSGIDVLRSTIQDFASSVSFSSHRKCIIYDEADYINPNSTQPALRGSIEEFSSNCAVIFTCNDKHRIIDALHSRCSVIDFSIPEDESVDIMKRMLKELTFILETENVEFDKKVLIKHLKNYYPDFRRTIIELQIYANSRGKIDVGILANRKTSTQIEAIDDLIEEGNTEKIFHWCHTSDHNQSVYDDLFKFWLKTKRWDNSILSDICFILSEYEHRASQSISPNLHLTACLTQVLKLCEGK